MKKRILFVFIVLLTLATVCTSYATKPLAPHVNDAADVLTDAEESELLQLYGRLETEYGISAMLVTVSSLNGKSAERYANDYYDANYRGSNSCLLLLIDVGGRNWYLLAEGSTYRDAYLDRIENAFYPYLVSGDYAGAFEAYLKTAYSAAPMLSSSSPGGFDLSELLVPILVVVVLSLLIAWGVTAGMKRRMKTARAKHTAHDYVRRDSFALKEHADLYLYRTQTRVRINNNSSSGGGRSGGSRGGRGGSF